MEKWNGAQMMRYVANKSTTAGTPEDQDRVAAEQDEAPRYEDYYCQCDEVATVTELELNKCSACGKQLV